MCGLTGFLDIHNSGNPDNHQRVTRMAERLTHRGPDAYGAWAEGPVALGHRRLSILDLSEAGAQPMLSDCQRYVIVFNGEIYNHLELRRELEAADAAPFWRGHSDTETLLAGVVYWGLDETLRRSSGMFALALWDCQERRLNLARDRMGEKPLYWGWAGDALVFGSELKALRQYPGFPFEVCPIALAQYFRYCYVPAPLSIHPGVYKLEPGCVLEVGSNPPHTSPPAPLRPGDCYGDLVIRRYWSLNTELESGHNFLINDEDIALSELEKALKTAISRQMLADVPLGSFLSGGIDSSLIVALMQEKSSRPVKTFTIGLDSDHLNEAPYAAAVARHLGTDHTEISVTDADARDVIPLLPDLYDEPFADSSQIPTYLVSKAARTKVTVALSGDGGDELFGGYNRYFWGPRIWSRLDWMPISMRQMLGKAITSIPISGWDRLGAYMAMVVGTRGAVSRPGDKAYKLAARLKNVHTLDDLYRSLVSEWTNAGIVIGKNEDYQTLIDDPLPAAYDNDAVARMMVQDMRTYLPDDILCKVDRAAMGVSLETRVPFLDPAVLAVSARLASRMKLRGGQGKWALRQLLYSKVPKHLIERPKAGFAIPVSDWLRGPLKPWAEDLLSHSSLSRDAVLNPEPIRKVWEEHLSGHRDWTPRLWTVLMFQAWRNSQP